MARVIITVECDGGSTTEITEKSLLPIHGGQQAALLVQEAFVRTCRALGVAESTAPAQAPSSETAVGLEPAGERGSPDGATARGDA